MAVTNTAKGPIKMTAQGDAVTGSTYITWLRWVGATTAGHTLVVSDTAGDLIAASEADGPNFIDIIPIFSFRNGITATTMASGTLYIHGR